MADRPARWAASHVGDLTGQRILVTGANSGIGLEAARIFARHGAQVVIAGRDPRKLEAAAGAIAGTEPGAGLDVLLLDLADLAAVREAAKAFSARYDRLDVLVNNAGVMAVPYRETPDGFELQFATNHLGHYALTGLLLDRLLAAPSPRVVTVSSRMHHFGDAKLENLDGSRGYRTWQAYCTSKLANMLFAFELQRRATGAGAPLLSVAAHPGYSRTNLQHAGPRMAGARTSETALDLIGRLVGQSAAMGALPTVHAAVCPGVRGGSFIGPMIELRGSPRRTRPSRAARDPHAARRLWQLSEQWAGVRYGALSGGI